MTKSGSIGDNGEHRNGNRSERISSRSRHASVILDLTGGSDRWRPERGGRFCSPSPWWRCYCLTYPTLSALLATSRRPQPFPL